MCAGEGGYSKVVPEAFNPDAHELTKEFGRSVGEALQEYIEAMEKVIPSALMEYRGLKYASRSSQNMWNVKAHKRSSVWYEFLLCTKELAVLYQICDQSGANRWSWRRDLEQLWVSRASATPTSKYVWWVL